MEIKQYNSKDFSSNSYVILNNNNAILIDAGIPQLELEHILDGRKLSAIFLTHGHFDHWINLENILNCNDNSTVYLSKNALKKLSQPDLSLSDYFEKQTLKSIKNSIIIDEIASVFVEEICVKILPLFGHTDCSFGFIIGNNFFCGDALFSDTIGRYDFPTSDAKQYFETLNNINKLPETLMCYSGHSAPFQLKQAKFFIPKYMSILQSKN